MRRALIPILVCLPILAATTVAHGDAVGHVNPIFYTIAGGTTIRAPLEFEEGEFRTDWVFMLSAIVDHATQGIDVKLVRGTESIADWHVEAGRVTQVLTARIPAIGMYEIHAANPGRDLVRFGFFYDVSCNCAGKPVPPEIPLGAVVFNYDVPKGSHMRGVFFEPPAHRLEMTLATRVNETSRWPVDFAPLQASLEARTVRGERFHLFEWNATQTQRFYVFAQVVKTDLSQINNASNEARILSVYVQPDVKRLNAPKESADVGIVAVACVAIAVVAFRRFGM